jgi:phosphoglycolate phosphatase
MTLKLVVFDCDGTMVDSQNGIVAAMAEAFGNEALAPPSRAAVLAVVGLSLPEAFDDLAARHAPDVRRRLAEHYKNAFAAARSRPEHTEPLFEGIDEVIAALACRDDILLGVATGKSQRGVERLFDAHRWHPHFVTIQTADGNPSKPHPGMLLRACAEAGVDPASAVMIGDTTFDMAMAVNAGCGAIGVGWGYHAREDIAAAGASVIVDAAHDLIPAIDVHFGRPV